MLCLLWMCISQWSCSYYALILWNAKNYNNGININMVSEPTWRKHNLQEEKRHCYRGPKLGFWKSESFQLSSTIESCALPQGSFWHLERTFLVARFSEKWNPSFTKYQKFRKPEDQKYQKHQSRNPHSRFEGVKFGFSKFWVHQHTRLNLAYLSPGSDFQNLKFEKLGFPHKTLSCSCNCSFRISCNFNCSCSISWNISCSTSCKHPWSFKCW